MIKQPKSIFNDVIGPVMRGPSSSHVAAALRIGKLARQMVKGNLKEVNVEFDPNEPLAASYHGHGSDLGLVGGLLNIEPNESRLVNSLEEAPKKGIKVNFTISDFIAGHPNAYKMTVISDQNEEVRFIANSVGGGMIEVTEIEGFNVSLVGDFFETLIFVQDMDEIRMQDYVARIIKTIINYDYCDYAMDNNTGLINIKTGYQLSDELLSELRGNQNVTKIIQLSPILQIKSRKQCIVPFNSSEEMMTIARKDNLQIWQLATLYESARGNTSEDAVFEMMQEIVIIMQGAVESGLKGTTYKDRILGPQAWMIEKNKEKLIPQDILNRVIAFITAIMEVKSSMGSIVAAPTAGSCGVVAGTILGTANELNLSNEDVIKGILAAGIIGVFIAENATFAAEVGGCQVECGAGSGMAAAGLVQLMGGTTQQAVDAASIALQNVLGMVCDPVADRVEVPCLGKNVMAGANALASANMALAGFDKVIPLDETIKAMMNVSMLMPVELRCTGQGGLSKTETAQRIYRDLL